MSIESINEQLLRSVGVGVALFGEESLELEFCNEIFTSWFQDTNKGDALSEVFPTLDQQAMRDAVASEGRHTTELKFKKKRRTLVVAQTFTHADVGDQRLLVLECQNITRIRELESMIESYSTMVERNTREIQREKDQVEKLLLNIMPRAAYEEYRDFGVVAPQRYESVSVLVLEFMDFAGAVENLQPATLISELNELYSSFDQIGEQLSCERIRTTGDTYRCMAGMHEPGVDHLTAVVNAATRFIRYLKRRNDNAETSWQCRIGIGSGSVVGSVVGNQKYVYDIFGEAVTSACHAREFATEMEILVLQDSLSAHGDILKTDQPQSTDAVNLGLIALAEK